MTPRGLWTRCRSPLCGKALRRDNTTGFCRHCVQGGPGRRWYLRTRADFARRHALQLANDRKYKEALREKRLCIRCRAPAPDAWRCASCREKYRLWQAAYRERRRCA
jgi:hypothetical protein